MKIVAIADTHNQFQNQLAMPNGDLLIHAGDWSDGTESGFIRFAQWFGSFPHKYKLCVAGNHDFTAQDSPTEVENILSDFKIKYLENTGTTIEGKKFWGSPYTPLFNDWAFMLDPQSLKRIWQKIPKDTDCLITHGPARGILDSNIWGQPCGCPILAKRIEEIRPVMHIFGHIHEARGTLEVNGIKRINCSLIDAGYKVRNKAQVVTL